MANSTQSLQFDIDDIYLSVIDTILSVQPNFAQSVLSFFNNALNHNKHTTKKIFITRLKEICELPDFRNDNTVQGHMACILKDIEKDCIDLKKYLTNSPIQTVPDFISKLQDLITKRKASPLGNAIPKNIKTGIDNISDAFEDLDLIDPDDQLIEVLNQSIDNYIALNQFPSAINCIRQLLAVYPNGDEEIQEERRLSILLAMLLSSVALEETEIQKKLALLNEAITIMESIDGLSVTDLYNIALYYSYKAEALAEEGDLEKAIHFNAIALSKIKDLDGSEANFANLKKCLNKNIIKLEWQVAVSLYDSNQYDAAIDQFNFLLTLNHQSIDAESCYHNLANCHFQRGLELIEENKYLEGLKYFKNAIQYYNAIETSNSKIEADKATCLQKIVEVVNTIQMNRKNPNLLFANNNNFSSDDDKGHKGQNHNHGLG